MTLRISIWQQFGSNHSASFTVVGTFATSGDARKAAEALSSTLQSISDWYSNPINAELVQRRREDVEEAYKYTAPEIIMNAQYQLDEQYVPIDWLDGGTVEAVQVFENRVLVENTRETWSHYPPFPQLLKKLGAESVLVADEFTSTIFANIRCMAPNGQAVDQVRHSIHTWQDYLISIHAVEWDGDILTLKGFSAWKLYKVLPSYIRWLQDLGFQVIDITFIRDPISDDMEDT